MYKADYKSKTVKDSTGNLETKTTLRAKFSFRSEVAPKDLQIVQRRLNFRKYNELSSYLKSVEGLVDTDSGIGYMVCREIGRISKDIDNLNRYVTICQYMRQTNISIRVEIESKKAIPLDKMFDLESFNKYVLTGQMDKPDDSKK